MKKLTKFFLSISYVGYIKYASGTWGSIASLVILFPLFKLLPLSILIFLFVGIFIISNSLINYFSSFTKTYDSKYIVIDEFLGIFTILFFYDLIFIYNDVITILLIFLTFRFFDIIKIFPANYVDKNFKNGYGVILDDLIAGIYSVLTLGMLNAFI